jgi:hypothetical protein
MKPWKLSIYAPEADWYPVRDWYDGQNAEVQAEFDADIQFFRANDNWSEAFDLIPLKKKYLGLYEIRTTFQDGEDELQFGTIGAFLPDSSEFVLFVVCNRYADEYFSCLDTALKYRQAWEKRDPKGAIYEYKDVMGQIG